MSIERQAWLKTSPVEDWVLEKAWGIGFRLMKIDPEKDPTGNNLALVLPHDQEKLEDAMINIACPQPTAAMMNPPIPKTEPMMTPDRKEYLKDERADKFTKIHKGQACYWLRQTGKTWQEIANLTGSSIGNTPTLAKNYAASNNFPWPLPIPSKNQSHEKEA